MEKKRCARCRHRKPLADFYRKKTSPDGHHAYCKSCHNQVMKDYYRRNRKKVLDWTNARKARVRREWTELMIELKDGKPCSDCRVSYPWYVLDFDHVRGRKRFGIAGSATRLRKQVLAELKKCDLVCANCHRKRTFERRRHATSTAT